MRGICIAAMATAILASSCASPATKNGQVVVIQMRDNHFEPDRIEVDRGETVTFRFINAGRNRHDAFIGDEDEQSDHEEEMRTAEDGDMHGGHSMEPKNAITVEPGKRGELTRTFAQRGKTLIGCHEPGHYEGGMVATVTVT